MEITTELVRTLIADQFPQWRDLPVSPVDRQGWDNRTFRLGDRLTVRLPSAEGYVAAVAKRDRFLPVLAEHLSLPVPAPVAVGRPAAGYPFPWAVRRWLPGATVEASPDLDRVRLARDLGGFLRELRAAPAQHGPAAGRHSYFRGCHPNAYGDQVEQVLERLGDGVDAVACQGIWARALTSVWASGPTWFHGDVAVGNLLVDDGALFAVIDFGTSGVGDPACDLVIAWNHFTGEERQVFREAVGLDDDAWRRARGRALWKALICVAESASHDPDGVQARVLAEVLDDPVVV